MAKHSSQQKPPKAQLKSGKIPLPRVPESSQGQVPVFSFQHLRKGFCISDCEDVEKVALADRLRELSQLTWAQIQAAPRHGQGCEVIAQKAIKGDSVPSCIDNETNLLAFRLHGKMPMVGFRDERLFSVVWIDREFKLYNHG